MVPALNNYRYALVSAEHDFEPYPCKAAYHPRTNTSLDAEVINIRPCGGSRFRATTNHLENALIENDARPLPQDATWAYSPITHQESRRWCGGGRICLADAEAGLLGRVVQCGNAVDNYGDAEVAVGGGQDRVIDLIA
jgi:hypothetical protein